MIDKLKQQLNQRLLQIEHRSDLSDDEKVRQIINLFAAICAAAAVQPIPFADYFVLTPLQAFMGERLSAIRGVPLGSKGARELIKELAGVAGLGLLGQQFCLAAYKTVVPFWGAVTTVPLVYGATYTIGQVMDRYLAARARNIRMSDSEIRDLWSRMAAEGRQRGQEHNTSNKGTDTPS